MTRRTLEECTIGVSELQTHEENAQPRLSRVNRRSSPANTNLGVFVLSLAGHYPAIPIVCGKIASERRCAILVHSVPHRK